MTSLAKTARLKSRSGSSPPFRRRALTAEQYHCNPNSVDRISLIKETSTCAYLMIIQTARLCHDVAFLPPRQDNPQSVLCSLVLAPDQVASYEENLAQLKRSETEARIWAEHPEADKIFHAHTPVAPQIAGDLVVGAHRIVPAGVKVAKSAIVGGGSKERYIATVASSQGWVLSSDELAKLGITRRNDVERLRKRAQALAKGTKWRLDVVDTARGNEYRFVVGSDRESDEAKRKQTSDEETKGSEEEFYQD